MYSLGWCWILLKTTFEVFPKVFYWVHVRGLGRPAKNLNVMVFKPLCSQSRHVFGVIVLLKIPFILLHIQLFKAFLHPILQNLTVLHLIHIPLHLYELPNSIPTHTTPYHEISSSSMFDCR